MKKIAIVYDWFDSWGGVERILLLLHTMYPQAVFFTSYRDENKTPWADTFETSTSFMQRLPSCIRTNRILSTPLYPFAFESFDFTGYDVVISLSSSFAKGIITRPETKHICYMLTPTRFLWNHKKDYQKGLVSLLRPYIRYLELWDLIASKRPDTILTLSSSIQKTIKDIYKQDSQLLYPPFDIAYWESIRLKAHKLKSTINSPYYLVVSRLEPYKKVDLVIDAFNTMPDKKLVIVGMGRDRASLRRRARGTIEFVESISDEELAVYYAHAKGFIMPQEEDFGYTALEAQYFGCPVIAYKGGGALETVIEGKTGTFFNTQSARAITQAIESFESQSDRIERSLRIYVPNHLKKFSKKNFIEGLSKIINDTM